MQVAKWGNSLAVRLPAEMVRALNLEAGDEVNLVPAMDSRTVTFTVERRRSRQEIVEGLRAYEGHLPKGFRFDREEANRRSGQS